MRDPTPPAVSFRVRDQADLLVGLQRIRQAGLLADADEVERSLMITIISELATNIMKYAGGGTLQVERQASGADVDVVVRAEDHGPGIANVEQAMRDHFTTGNTLGLGLPGVRRMADHFEIRSAPGQGTRVEVRRRTVGRRNSGGPPPAARPHSAPTVAPRMIGPWEIGLRTRPMPGELRCGDLALALEMADGLLLALVDGTGHGENAALAADRIRVHLTSWASADLKTLMQGAHQALLGTVGAAVSLLFVSPRLMHARYLGVGNTGLARRAGASWRPVSKDGMLGHRLPTLLEQGTDLASGDLLVLWTDGLGGMPDAVSPRDTMRGAQELADGLVERQGKAHDDAGCMVLRWRN